MDKIYIVNCVNKMRKLTKPGDWGHSRIENNLEFIVSKGCRIKNFASSRCYGARNLVNKCRGRALDYTFKYVIQCTNFQSNVKA